MGFNEGPRSFLGPNSSGSRVVPSFNQFCHDITISTPYYLFSLMQTEEVLSKDRCNMVILLTTAQTELSQDFFNDSTISTPYYLFSLMQTEEVLSKDRCNMVILLTTAQTELSQCFYNDSTISTPYYLFSLLQTEEVLSKDSAEALNEGKNPGPLTEIK